MEATYWRSSGKSGDSAQTDVQAAFRASVARGNALFTSRTFSTAGVAGFPSATGTCASCHNAPGAGSNLSGQAMDVGTTVYASPESAPTDLPLFKVTCHTGRTIYTSDPGRALITGRCVDVGAILMQQFRGLSARAPYFSNGSAETLRDVVDFYDRRFHIALTESEKQDLVNFLSVL
jgi:cytochrome c peroxidase